MFDVLFPPSTLFNNCFVDPIVEHRTAHAYHYLLQILVSARLGSRYYKTVFALLIASNKAEHRKIRHYIKRILGVFLLQYCHRYPVNADLITMSNASFCMSFLLSQHILHTVSFTTIHLRDNFCDLRPTNWSFASLDKDGSCEGMVPSALSERNLLLCTFL